MPRVIVGMVRARDFSAIDVVRPTLGRIPADEERLLFDALHPYDGKRVRVTIEPIPDHIPDGPDRLREWQ